MLSLKNSLAVLKKTKALLEVTALIGPSGCGKSTFIRCINRMNDVIDICKVTGNIEMDGLNINDKDLDVVSLRERVGMVFQIGRAHV